MNKNKYSLKHSKKTNSRSSWERSQISLMHSCKRSRTNTSSKSKRCKNNRAKVLCSSSRSITRRRRLWNQVYPCKSSAKETAKKNSKRPWSRNSSKGWKMRDLRRIRKLRWSGRHCFICRMKTLRRRCTSNNNCRKTKRSSDSKNKKAPSTTSSSKNFVKIKPKPWITFRRRIRLSPRWLLLNRKKCTRKIATSRN